MNYTVLKQWKTLTGEYHSTTVDYSNYDSAIGNLHAMFQPMQNDPNVASFVLMLVDETGKRINKSEWVREVPEPEPEEVEEA